MQKFDIFIQIYALVPIVYHITLESNILTLTLVTCVVNFSENFIRAPAPEQAPVLCPSSGQDRTMSISVSIRFESLEWNCAGSGRQIGKKVRQEPIIG